MKKSNKSEFIRQHLDMAPQEVVALAKKHGLDITIGHVYVQRSNEKAKLSPKPKAARKSKRAKAPKAETVVVAANVQPTKPAVAKSNPVPPAMPTAVASSVLTEELRRGVKALVTRYGTTGVAAAVRDFLSSINVSSSDTANLQ